MNPAQHGTFAFTGLGGRRLFGRHCRVPSPRAIALIVHGYAEHSGRYLHVMDAFAARGIASIAADHRGHGQSGGTRGDLEAFAAVVEDQRRLLDRAAAPAEGLPLFAVGHSLGALVCLELTRRDNRVSGIVLSSAAVAVPPHIHPRSILLARALSRVAPRLPIQRHFDPTRATRDPAVQAQMRADPLGYRGRIRARTGQQILDAQARLSDVLPTIRTPALICHGGQDPTIPVPAAAQLHARLGSTDKELAVFPSLRHELHQEPERDEVLGRWGVWMRRRTG